jgi:hypothetical protein
MVICGSYMFELNVSKDLRIYIHTTCDHFWVAIEFTILCAFACIIGSFDTQIREDTTVQVGDLIYLCL